MSETRETVEEALLDEIDYTEEKRKTAIEITPEDMDAMTIIMEKIGEAIEGKITVDDLKKTFEETIEKRMKKKEEQAKKKSRRKAARRESKKKTAVKKRKKK